MRPVAAGTGCSNPRHAKTKKPFAPGYGTNGFLSECDKKDTLLAAEIIDEETHFLLLSFSLHSMNASSALLAE